MATVLNPAWSRPSTILFASEVPANEKAFAYCLAQALEFGAEVIVFHAYDTLVGATSETSGVHYYDYAAAARAEIQHLEPLAERVRASGLHCEVVVRPGLAADQILAYTQEREVDRIVTGTHSPGPIGKILVGSVAEAVLRASTVPVYIVGPEVLNASIRKPATKTILCAVSMLDTSVVVAAFAAELAAQHGARLLLQHVIKPRQTEISLAGRSTSDLERDLAALVPPPLREKIRFETIVVPGDPTDEVLYQSRSQAADLIVLGAQEASAFAAITRHGVVYKVLAHAQCPAITLSPAVLSRSGATGGRISSVEAFTAGVL